MGSYFLRINPDFRGKCKFDPYFQGTFEIDPDFQGKFKYDQIFNFLYKFSLFLVPGYPQAQTSAPVQPTQAPPQPPLDASTPSPSISCSNLQLDSDCTFWASQGDCNPGSGWETWMAQNCAKTCETCSNPDPNTPNLPVATTQQPSQNCANIESDSNCNSWASTGICSSSLSQYCQKSCGLCSTTFLPLRTTKSHVPKPTKAPVNQCKNKDNDANCTYYAYLGFCKKASYASYMAQNCKKSCNLC